MLKAIELTESIKRDYYYSGIENTKKEYQVATSKTCFK